MRNARTFPGIAQLLVVGALSIGLALVLMDHYRAAFEPLSQWELTRFDHFWPGLHALLIAVVCMLPLLLLLFVRRAGSSSVTNTNEVEAAAAEFRRRLLAMAVFLAVAATIAGLFAFLSVNDTGPRRTISVVGNPLDLSSGPATLSGGEVDSRVLVIHWRDLSGTRDQAFATLSVANQAPQFFVELVRQADGRYSLPSRDGLLMRDGLPGALPVFAESTLGRPIASPNYVLFRDASGYRLERFLVAEMFAIAAVVFGLAAGFQSWHLGRLRKSLRAGAGELQPEN